MVFLAADNPAWTVQNQIASYRNTNMILPEGIQKHIIRLRLNDENILDQIVNIAEISEMKDGQGNLIGDFDSTPDRIKSNDRGGQPNTPLDNALNDPDDEDDHDSEALYVNDLALIKTMASQTTAKPGDVIVFNLQVKNQGNTHIHKFELTDYIPSGFEFLVAQNPNWQLSGDQAIFLSKRELHPTNLRLFRFP